MRSIPSVSKVLWMLIGVSGVLVLQYIVKSPGPTVYIDTSEDFTISETSGVLQSGDSPRTASRKTQVVRHDGTSFQTLTDFCTWTVPLDCVIMKTDDGAMPLYIHRVANDGSKHENNMHAIFSEFLTYPEAGFIDIGAQVGLFSLHAARKGRRVISVEPLVEHVQRLCKSVQRNGFTSNVTIVFNALSDVRKAVTFKNLARNVGETKNSKNSDTGAENCEATETTYSVFLDDLLPFVTFKTALLKVDVGQHEFHVINGGQKFLRSIHVPVILMEWYHVKKGSTAKPLLKLMDSLKYSPYSPSIKRTALPSADYLNWPFDVLWVKQKV